MPTAAVVESASVTVGHCTQLGTSFFSIMHTGALLLLLLPMVAFQTIPSPVMMQFLMKIFLKHLSLGVITTGNVFILTWFLFMYH